jgi:hypothetical protein
VEANESPAGFQLSSTVYQTVRTGQRRPSPQAESLHFKNRLPTDNGQTDVETSGAMDAWAKLPEASRAGILAMVRTARSILMKIVKYSQSLRVKLSITFL